MSALAQPRDDATLPWDALPCAAVRLDRDGSAREANRLFAVATGLHAGAACGPRWLALLSEPSRDALLAALRRGEDFALQLQARLRHEPCEPRGASEASEALPVPAPSAGDGPHAWVLCVARWEPERGQCVCLLHDLSAVKRAELAARAQVEQFRLLADNVPALIACYDARSLACLFANQQYAATFGWTESTILGRTVEEVIGGAAAREIQPQVDVVLRQRRAVAYERRLVRPDGTPQWIEVNLLPHLGPDGVPAACFVLISDITRHRLAEQALRESEERFAKFTDASCEGIVFHRNGLITDANAPACALVGLPLADLLGRSALDFVAPDALQQVLAAMHSGQETAYESAIVNRGGERIPVEVIVRTMERAGERLRMTIVRDIRDRHAAQARIQHLAHHDPLTGLPNRTAFMEHLDRRMSSARAGGKSLALLFIDLDHFKRVNDSLGHLAGDTLLQTVAQRLTEGLRSTDLVARFGGDEFMVLLADGAQREQVADVARKLLAAVEVPVQAEGRPITVTPSIGIALFPGDALTPAELIKNADTAMYRAKARGRATVQFFEPKLAARAYAALVVEGQLAQALERGEFVLHFQPQVRARDGRLVGAEALIRWHHPERGLLLPDAFIPIAEQQRLMLPIGSWVLREAVRSARRWQALGVGEVPVAVNLSTLQFHAPDFVPSLAALLREEGLPGTLLELELTERMLMDDLPDVRRRLGELKRLGIRLSVDDFGTGYSSLGHLKELPIDKMKIDRSFVRDLPQDRDSAAIARAIVQMARSLGITAIAEGVETEAQRAFLASVECDELQGDAVSPPLPTPAFDTWIDRTRAA